MNATITLASCLYLVTACYTMGVLAAQVELGLRIPLERVLFSTFLAPVFAIREMRELGRVQERIREQQLRMFLRYFGRHPKNPKSLLVYLMYNMGSTEEECQRVVDDLVDWSHDENDVFARWLFDRAASFASKPGYGYPHFVAYVGSAAQRTPEEVQSVVESLARAQIVKPSRRSNKTMLN